MQNNEYVETMNCAGIIEAVLETKIKNNEKLQELIKFFGFEQSLKKKYKTLSGGQKQRLTIILVLMQDSPLTFFDEVTSGLDFETRRLLMDKITQWYEGKNSAVMLVTHYYEELEKMADKILILDQGKLVCFGKKEDLFAQYCGYSVVTMPHTEQTLPFEKNYKRLAAPSQTLAFACKDKEQELELISSLNQWGVNFRRSDTDVEILYLNALNSLTQASHKGGTVK